MPRVAIGDIQLYCKVQGTGAPLLLIAGFGASSAVWQPALHERLERSFRLVTFDNRGTGRSDRFDGALTIAQMADDAMGLLDVLGIAPAHVMGVSMGGYIAQELALRRPETVNRLVLGCTHCGPPVRIPVPRELLAPLMDPSVANDPREGVRRVWPAWYTPEFIASARDFLEEQLDRTLAYPTPLATRERQMDAVVNWSSHERLHELAAPTLIITGDRDALVFPKNARILHERIAGSRLHVIKGAGHVFWHSHADEVLEVVTEFLTLPESTAQAR